MYNYFDKTAGSFSFKSSFITDGAMSQFRRWSFLSSPNFMEIED